MSQEPVKHQPKLPRDNELQQLQNELDEPYRTMVWLTCATGVPVSELWALRWGTIDRVHSCLWVREAVHNGKTEELTAAVEQEARKRPDVLRMMTKSKGS